MEYVQEQITTLHGFSTDVPAVRTDTTAVIVPMAAREFRSAAATHVLTELSAVDPERVIVPLRAPADEVDSFEAWFDEFDLSIEMLWCSGPAIAELLSEHGLHGERGKGRDVWLALGTALESEYIVLHDADTITYDRTYVPRLLFPLMNGHTFSKGYYARIEDNQFYGRLFRLFYEPTIRALSDRHTGSILEYLDSFRYALAGEFAGASDLMRRLRIPRSWGLEVGTLGDAFSLAGFSQTAQVDLGAYEHDHRPVAGETGLSDMSTAVGTALFLSVEEHGITPEYDALREEYRKCATALVRQYGLDAAYNGFTYDQEAETAQVAQYASAITQPTIDTRLPAWANAPIKPKAVTAAAEADRKKAIVAEQ